ncbi:hypothetical protein RRF57_002134 [Xylaria bambusicola]|uniref:DUF676 domain-containing protein n=1 Tax=Xylaria bambusicola TaxID=326684 RepID=A0AAN7US95_9PEZI
MESFKKRLGRPFRRLAGKDEQHIPNNASGGGDNTGSASVQRLFPENKIYGLRDVYVPEDAIVDVVFLHGLNGRADKTFLHERSGTYWPADLLPSDLPNARILSYGYDARVATFFGGAGQNTLQGHASNLFNALANDSSETNSIPRKIIFVAHSLGGLVVKRALALSEASANVHLRRMERDTIGIVFLGTPHRGADMASFIKTISNILKSAGKRTNPEILEVLQTNSQVLASVEDSFSNWLRRTSGRFELSCFCETLELLGVGMVVKSESATIAGWPTQFINANHMDMAKFPDSDDDGYRRVRGELKRWIQPLSAHAGGEALESSTSMERERTECLNTLYFQEWNARETRIDDVDQGGDWLSSHKEYINWLENPCSDSLWIEGKPGSGKSTLAKRIVRKWRYEYNDPSNMNADHDKAPIIAAFYYSFRGGFTETSHELMLHMEPRQEAVPSFERDLSTTEIETDDHSMTEPFWRYDNLKSVLQCLHQVNFPLRIFLVADGMDESDNTRRTDLLNFLRKLSSQTSNCVIKVLVASRPETDIHSNIHKSRHIILQQENREDILKVISRWFERLENQSKENDSKDEPPFSEGNHCPDDFRGIRDYIVENSQGVFLWVSLVLKDLDKLIRRGAYTPDALEKRVRKLPKELGGPGGFYHEIVQSLVRSQEDESLDEDDKEEHRNRTTTILTWVTFSKEPISLSYLEDVLATPLQIENKDLPGYDFERHRPRELDRGLISYCGGLLEVRIPIPTTLALLNVIGTQSANGPTHTSDHRSDNGYLKSFIEEVVSHPTSYVALLLFDWLVRHWPSEQFRDINRLSVRRCLSSAVVCAATGGQGNALLILLLLGADANAKGGQYGTALQAASYQGHRDIVEMLLSYGADVNAKGGQYGTALHAASYQGHRNIGPILIKGGADVNAEGGQYGTALQAASYQGHRDVVEMLLSYRADVNAEGGQYGTALHAASYQGHRDIVEMLLSYRADVNAEGGQYGTALQTASHKGHKNIVQMLIDRGADPDLGRAT